MAILRFVPTLLAGGAVLAASPAAGQAPEVSFAAGRVTITAHETPPAAILGAWERHGGPRFVDAGRLPDQPVSVHLVDVPEGEALRVLLRAAAGYVVIPRAVTQPGASAYDRVFIMEGSASPQAGRDLPASAPTSVAAHGADGQPRPAEPPPAPAETRAGTPAGTEFDEWDGPDELELVETLRRRYQAVDPAAADPAAPSFRSQPDGSPLGTAPRPGMVIQAEEPRNVPNPVRRRDR